MTPYFLLWFFAISSFATVYPERSNTEVFYLKDSAMDFGIRLKLIEDAKYSIDLISFSQAMDKTGEIFIGAIRQAQEKKCIKVRYLYDSVASLLDRDFLNTSGKILSDPALKCPGQVITLDIFEKWKAGLEWDDFFHEKLLLIDAGTAEEKLVIGGRGYTEFSTQVADSGYLFRPLDPQLPSLGTDILTSFNQLWELAKKISSPLKHNREIKVEYKQSSLDYFVRTPEQKRELDSLINIINRPPEKIINSPIQFRPTLLQLMSNDLLHNLVELKNLDRERLKNDNLEKLTEDINHFNGSLDVTSYSIAFPEELFVAMVNFLRRGNTLNLFTNGQAAHAVFVYDGTPVYYTLEFLEKLIDATKDMNGKLNIYFLDPLKDPLKALFIHRKLITFSGDNKLVYTGTDNFTWSAAKKNDEWMIKLVDDKLVEYFEQTSKIELSYYQSMSAETIKSQKAESGLLYWLFRSFIRDNY